jgi:hypothetical protein
MEDVEKAIGKYMDILGKQGEVSALPNSTHKQLITSARKLLMQVRVTCFQSFGGNY